MDLDWKSVLLGDCGDCGRERLHTVVASLEEVDVKQVLQLITTHLSTKSDEISQIRTLTRLKRRQSDNERYGTDLLQERIAVGLSQNHPLWKKHGLSSVTTWQQWCNRIYDSIGEYALDLHLKRLWPDGPRPFYARLAVVKSLIDGLQPGAAYYPNLDDEKALRKSLDRQKTAELNHILAEFASIQR